MKTMLEVISKHQNNENESEVNDKVVEFTNSIDPVIKREDIAELMGANKELLKSDDVQ